MSGEHRVQTRFSKAKKTDGQNEQNGVTPSMTRTSEKSGGPSTGENKDKKKKQASTNAKNKSVSEFFQPNRSNQKEKSVEKEPNGVTQPKGKINNSDPPELIATSTTEMSQSINEEEEYGDKLVITCASPATLNMLKETAAGQGTMCSQKSFQGAKSSDACNVKAKMLSPIYTSSVCVTVSGARVKQRCAAIKGCYNTSRLDHSKCNYVNYTLYAETTGFTL